MTARRAPFRLLVQGQVVWVVVALAAAAVGSRDSQARVCAAALASRHSGASLCGRLRDGLHGR